MRHTLPTTTLFLLALLAGCAAPSDDGARTSYKHQIDEDARERSDEDEKLQFQIEERERADREAADLKAAQDAADLAEKERAEKRDAIEADEQARREAAERAAEEEAEKEDRGEVPSEFEDAPPPLYGQVTSDGVGVSGARICIRASETCVWSDADGYFKLNGLEDGVSEELVVHSPDHPVVIAPIELFPSEYRWLDLPLPPRGQSDVNVGSVYVVSQGFIEFGVQAEPLDGTWKLMDAKNDFERVSRGAAELMTDVRPGLYEARFTPNEFSDCLRVLGWANPDASGQHLSVLAPVYGGAVTVIAKVCAAG